MAWNIFDVSSLIEIAGNGQVFLTDEQVATLNAVLAKEGLLKAFQRQCSKVRSRSDCGIGSSSRQRPPQYLPSQCR